MGYQRLYYWHVITSEGDLHQGASIGNGRQQIYLQLMAQGYQPLKLKYGQTLTRHYWKTPARIAVFKQLAALLEAGLPLLDALRLIADQHEQAGWRCLLGNMADHIAGGESFSNALRLHPQVFPPLYVTLVSVGELTGKLDTCCQQLAQQQEQQYQLQQKVKKALRYPCFVLCIALLVSIVMLTWVLPEFAELYAAFDTPLPPLTQRMIVLSRVLSEYWLLLPSVPACLGLLYAVCRQRYPVLLRHEQSLLLKIPLISALLRGKALSHLFTLLALTQRAGLTLPTGLEAATTLPYILYRDALHPILSHIQQGVSVHQAIQPYTRLFPPPCTQLIRVGEETGALDLIFAQLAEWHQQHTSQRAETLAQTLEPLMMLVIGGIIGTLVVAMYLPIFQLGDVMANA